MLAFSPIKWEFMFAGCVLTAAVCATLEKTNVVKSQDNISVGLFFFLLGASKLVSCAANCNLAAVRRAKPGFILLMKSEMGEDQN